jgi:hypothetical protein
MELDFQRLKAKALDEELPSVDVNADGSLPGWGQWGGDGMMRFDGCVLSIQCDIVLLFSLLLFVFLRDI